METSQDSAAQAAEFLKTWQEQLTRQMTDPAAIHAMLSAFSAFAQPPQSPPSQPSRDDHDARARRSAPAPDAADDAIRRLTERLRTVERELRSLRAELGELRGDAGDVPVAAQAKNPARAKRAVVAGSNPRVSAATAPKTRKPRVGKPVAKPVAGGKKG